MDSQTKSAIKSLVLNLRHTLEDELAIVLGRYGLFTDREWSLKEPPARLTDEADREIWRRIVAVVRRGMKEGRTLSEASQDYIRESAFTILNRLVGLKCLEVRGIIDEVITTRKIYGGRSKAHRDYRDAHPREARAADDAMPASLEAMCRHVNEELIGYLFDPDDDRSLVWPRYAVLRECIEKINDLDEAAWREDEIIGWIYQFYNAEEKVAIRRRGKPKTPHDVAVINQFFTPRWIVKFLVDNTLGRLWLEMHPDSERVRAKCDYLVPEPLPADEGDEGDDESFHLDPDSPINNREAAPRRGEKPITEIRLLDPACGTMHFGHYACEVFDCMYRDARDRGEVQIEDRRIPTAILEHNLFGVDIDRRAVQLAALSLFMKARTMHPQAEVRQVNLVVADATLPDSGVKKRFLARYAHDPRLQNAFAQVLEDMDQVAQVGSLLRVEERLRELLADAGHTAVGALDSRRQRELPGRQPDVRQMGLAELAEDEEATKWTPHYTLQELRDDLRAFGREALEEHEISAQLFATEADKAARLLDVLMGQYDVVVMNPPYGGTTSSAKTYVRTTYPATRNDLYAAFFERSLDLCSPGGYVGALTSRTFLYLSSFRGLREDVVLRSHSPVALLDLGFGVLDDAVVETAASVICRGTRRRDGPIRGCVFVRMTAFGHERNRHLEIAISRLVEGIAPDFVFTTSPLAFRLLPRAPFAYWSSRSLRDKFSTLRSFDPNYGIVRQGKATGDDRRFLREWWEVPREQIGQRWQFFAKGGSYCKYYSDVDLVIDWSLEAQQLHAKMGNALPNRQHYFKEGLTYPLVTVKGLNVRHLGQGCVFGHKGPLILTKSGWDAWSALSMFNSQLVQGFVLMLTPSRSFEVGYVGRVPFPESSQIDGNVLAEHSKQAYQLKAAWDSGSEVCTRFISPWLAQVALPAEKAFEEGLGRVPQLVDGNAEDNHAPSGPLTLKVLLDEARGIERIADARLEGLQAEIDRAVYELYQISAKDRALIEREVGHRPRELVWPQTERKSDEDKRREHVRRFFSHYALQAVRADEDGIVPLAGCGGQEPYLVDRVRLQLETEYGADVAYQFEQDAAEYLGSSLEEWLHRYFFSRFHVKLYKKRPILWHLTSPKGAFAVMVDYHQLTRDTLPKVRSQYLWPQMEAARTRLAALRRAEGSVRAVAELEDELADLQDCEERLTSVIQGTVEVALPDWANGPYRGGAAPYDPDIDDGVRVNLLPIQAAGLLPVKKVV